MEKIHLESLAPFLQATHVKLKLSFLKRLLEDAAKSKTPHRESSFAELIDCPMNVNRKSSTTIYGWLKGYRTVPFSKLDKILKVSKYTWHDLERNLISIKSGIRRGEIFPRFPIKMGGRMGSIVGHILGDGSIDKRFHSVFYANSDRVLLQEFCDCINSIFRISPRIWVQKRRGFHEKSQWMKRVYDLEEIPYKHCAGLFCPKICCDILYILCGKFAEGKDKKITPEIKKLNTEFKKGLIRAFFDDEASVNAKSHTIRFHQDNKIMLEDIRNLIREFSINSQTIRSYLKREKLRYYFNITGFKEYYAFFHKIGCASPKKRKEFLLLINTVSNSRSFKKKYSL